MQLVSPGISLETFLNLLSPSPGGMNRRLSEESNFLSVLLAQWTGIDNSPAQVRIPSGTVLKADLEQRISSYEQLNGESALAVSTPTALSTRRAASGPAQGEPFSELLTKEGQIANEGQPSIPGSNAFLVGSLMLPWMTALILPPAGETEGATSGPVDTVELLTAAQAVLQPQAAIQPQRTMLGKMETITGREDIHFLLGRGNNQAHMERRPLAMAYGISQAVPDLPVMVSWSGSETEALVTLSGKDRVPVGKSYDTVNDLETEFRVIAEMASQTPVNMTAGVEVRPPLQLYHPLWLRPPVVQWVSLEESTELTGILAARPWHQRGPALSQTGSQSVKGESALTQLGEVPLIDLTQRGLYHGEAAQWGTALEAIEVLVEQVPFSAGQVMTQSAAPAVIAQQLMPQVRLASQKAFLEDQPSLPLGWESDKGETALSLPPSRRMGEIKGRLVESSVRPFAQMSSADLTLNLPGSLSTQAALAIHEAAEETNPEHALSRVFDELIDRVYVTFRRGESEWRLQLRPHSLGHLEVRLNADARGITLVMRVETPEAQALIQANLDQLKNGLTERGIQLERCDVVISRADVEEMSLAGHFGGWEGMASRSYEILKPELPRRATALQPQAEPIETTQSLVMERIHSLIDLQV